MAPVTLDELLQALEEAGSRNTGEGFTIAEFRATNPRGDKRARGLIKRAIDKGLVRVSHKEATDMAGRVITVPSYVPIKRRRPK